MAGFNPVPIMRGAILVALIAFGAELAIPALAQAGAGGSGGAPDYPIPSTAGEAYSPIREGFASPIEPRADLRGPKPDGGASQLWPKAAGEGLPNANPFFRDTELKLFSRTYWLSEDAFGLAEPEALTSGGHLSYQSGFLGGFLQLRGALYTSQPLYAPPGAGSTLNLTPSGDQITTLGQANARLTLAGQELTLGRQLVRTVYINPHDDRMIPNTFEGIVLLPERDPARKLDYIASYLWRFKPRNTDEFIPFSQSLGVEQDEGVLINGVGYHGKSFNVGVTNYWIKDAMNTAYGEIDYLLPFGGEDGPSFRVSINDTDQRSVGEELMPGSPFQTYQASARLVASYRNFVLSGAVSQVGQGAPFRKPFGNSPAFTAMMISAFQRAGETGFLGSLSYDFSPIGLAGLKVFVGWGWGVDAVDRPSGAALPDRDELDLRLEYEPHSGPLEGLQVKLEYVDERLIGVPRPSEDLRQFRAVVNYVVPLMQ